MEILKSFRDEHKLNGQNYPIWSFKVKKIMIQEGIWDVFSDAPAVPAADPAADGVLVDEHNDADADPDAEAPEAPPPLTAPTDR
jgi:hypothetical protein